MCACDHGLASLVHLQRKLIDHIAAVLRGVFHSAHTRRGLCGVVEYAKCVILLPINIHIQHYLLALRQAAPVEAFSPP